jgi:phosphatidate cytidylyltransferase
MDKDRRSDPDEKRGEAPEGVRIIGAEEAAEALERPDIAHRRTGDQLRYGDRPPSPPADGPRPVLRFPLGSSDDPNEVERPPVAPSSPPSGPPSEQIELPHWTEPPTGQVPAAVAGDVDEPADEGDDLDAWAAFGQAPRWRDETTRSDDDDHDVRVFGDDSARLGALDESERISHEDYLSFADLDEHVAPGRSVFAEADEVDVPPVVPIDDPDLVDGPDPDDEPGGDTAGALWEPPPYEGEPTGAWRSELDDFDAEDDAVAAWEGPTDDEPDYEVADETDPWEPPPRRRRTAAERAASRRPRGRAVAHARSGPPSERDMGMAVIVGVALVGVALLLFNIGPAAAMILVTAVIGLAAAELFGVLRQAGFQPVTLVGISGTVGLVLGAYNYGPAAIPTVLFLTTAVCLLWYLVGASHESPVMNVGVTLGVVLWVGLFGSFAALMLSLPAMPGGGDEPGLGILLAAIFGTVGYDVGGLFVGRNAGRQPLSSVSPNKTVEGLLGGCAIAFVVVVLGTALKGWGPIDSTGDGILVGLAIAIAAPLGDLVESLVKRDLGVKDMGSILPGHGGVLDRFDAMLFVLPTIWLLATVKDYFA